VNWIGDVLFSTPAIRAIRKKYPEAFIACLVPPRCAGLLKNNPYLNEVIEAEERIPPYSFFSHWRIISELRRRRFNTAIFFHRSKTKVFWAWVFTIPASAIVSATIYKITIFFGIL
jgi:ADP-heptose:LPS heptosyltransferase